MFHIIDLGLSAADLTVLQTAVAGLEYEDGAKTAGTLARAVKRNAQAADTPARAAVLKRVEAALLGSPLFLSAARPRAFARLAVSRYEGGQTYGSHVDDALMNGLRTDLSMTLFLSDPVSYDGGELVIEDRIEDRGIKLPAGQLILYPSDTLHRVEPVTAGTRLAVVGWVQSLVRDPAKREILFDLDQAFAAEEAAGGNRDQLNRLSKTRSNLLRMWSD